MSISVNGHPVIFSLAYVTEPGEGWQGRQFIGAYETIEELNKALPKATANCPLYWTIEIDFQDAEVEV